MSRERRGLAKVNSKIWGFWSRDHCYNLYKVRYLYHSFTHSTNICCLLSRHQALCTQQGMKQLASCPGNLQSPHPLLSLQRSPHSFPNTQPASLHLRCFSSLRNVLNFLARKLMYRLMWQRINIPEGTLNQGWRKLVDGRHSFLSSPYWQWDSCEACSTQPLVGAQRAGTSVAPRGSILVFLIGPPGITTPDNDKNKKNATTNCSALWLLWQLCTETSIGQRKRNICLTQEKLSVWPRSHLQQNPWLRFCFGKKSKPRQTHISICLLLAPIQETANASVQLTAEPGNWYSIPSTVFNWTSHHHTCLDSRKWAHTSPISGKSVK